MVCLKPITFCPYFLSEKEEEGKGFSLKRIFIRGKGDISLPLLHRRCRTFCSGERELGKEDEERKWRYFVPNPLHEATTGPTSHKKSTKNWRYKKGGILSKLL